MLLLLLENPGHMEKTSRKCADMEMSTLEMPVKNQRSVLCFIIRNSSGLTCEMFRLLQDEYSLYSSCPAVLRQHFFLQDVQQCWCWLTEGKARLKEGYSLRRKQQ
ncbi:hypothetical protein E2I00_007138 [Balaenoptera physalus]|uniref:Uncharacterized protein n=1 Tax=Balaenoptera physalus TaxID=9770 RepID=A0A643BWK6_BALPH|nr:hypothetical protein E2I00_007138 [Balaenoptera physalus]